MESGFAQTIRAERERLCMTQCAFADRVGCSLATLKRWESGQVVPNQSQREAAFQAILSGSAPLNASTGFHAGWWLRIARNRMHLTIRDAASATQTSSSAWHRYESGAAALGTQQTLALTQALGMQSDELPVITASPAKEIERASELFSINPSEGLRLAVGALLSLRSGEPDPSALGNGHACLGKLLVSTGDYSLGGEAFSEAIRLHRLHRYDPAFDRTNAYISTAWAGFQLSGNARASRGRMHWVEAQIKRLPKREVAGYCIPRAIYADKAGRPDLAAEVMHEARRLPSEVDTSESHVLLSAWLRAKYGDPRSVTRSVSSLLDSPNVSTKFAANKIALDAYVNLRAWTDARHHYQTLRAIESECGIRLTGFSAAQLRALEG